MPKPKSNEFKTVNPRNNSKVKYQNNRQAKDSEEKSNRKVERKEDANGFYTINTYIDGKLARVKKYNKYNKLYCDLHYVDDQLQGQCELYQLDEKQSVTQSGYSLKFYCNRLTHRTNYVDGKRVSEFFYNEDENMYKVVYYVNDKTGPGFTKAHEAYDMAFWKTFYQITGLKNTLTSTEQVDPDAAKQEFQGLQMV